MARVQTYSGAFLRGLPPAYLASGMGQDSTDVFSSDYNPLTPVDVSGGPTIGVPYANAPPYEPAVPINTPSGVYDPVTGTYVSSLPASQNPAGTVAATPSAPGSTLTLPSFGSGTIIPGGTSIPIGTRPSPTVNVPLSTSSVGLWFGSSTLVPGVPNYLFALAAVVLGGALLGGSAFSAGRYKVAKRR